MFIKKNGYQNPVYERMDLSFDFIHKLKRYNCQNAKLIFSLHRFKLVCMQCYNLGE